LMNAHLRDVMPRQGTKGLGHVYQGRYRNHLIQSDWHFLNVCRYVESNARRAGLCKRAEQPLVLGPGAGDQPPFTLADAEAFRLAGPGQRAAAPPFGSERMGTIRGARWCCVNQRFHRPQLAETRGRLKRCLAPEVPATPGQSAAGDPDPVDQDLCLVFLNQLHGRIR
jgi:hypothetical protein